MEQWLEKMESSDEDEEDSFETLIDKLKRSRKKEARHSEEKVGSNYFQFSNTQLFVCN
jgi:hypothetical protein